MSLANDPVVAEFVIESRDHMGDIENQLLAFEAAGADIDEELVNTVFRAVHSIKGASGFLGFTTLGKLAHKLENVFNLIRNRELIPDSTNVDVMLKAADSIRAMIDDIEHSEEYDITSHVAELQAITDAVEGPAADEGVSVTTPAGPSDTTSAPASAEPSPESGGGEARQHGCPGTGCSCLSAPNATAFSQTVGECHASRVEHPSVGRAA